MEKSPIKTVDAVIVGLNRGGWSYHSAAADKSKVLLSLDLSHDSVLRGEHPDRHDEQVRMYMLVDISEAHHYVVGDHLVITIQKAEDRESQEGFLVGSEARRHEKAGY